MISFVHSTMDEVGFVKTFRKQIRRICDLVKSLDFQGSETLFYSKTCIVFTSSIMALGILLKPFVPRAVQASLANRANGFNLELVMSCLFFVVPKNNKGFIHYKPLKIPKAKF